MLSSGPITFTKLKSGGYRLLRPAWVQTKLFGCAARVHNAGKLMLELTQEGRLWVGAEYQWDGASGPVIDRKTNYRAGLFHDAMYQLFRSGKLDPVFRRDADELYRDVYKQDGGWSWIGWMDFAGLRMGAGYAARRQPEVEAKVLRAP